MFNLKALPRWICLSSVSAHWDINSMRANIPSCPLHLCLYPGYLAYNRSLTILNERINDRSTYQIAQSVLSLLKLLISYSPQCWKSFGFLLSKNMERITLFLIPFSLQGFLYNHQCPIEIQCEPHTKFCLVATFKM